MTGRSHSTTAGVAILLTLMGGLALAMPVGIAQSNGSFHGFVAGEDGTPVAAAAIRVEDALGAASTTSTDASGYFEVKGLSSGRAQVQVAHPCCTRQARTAPIESGPHPSWLNVTLWPQTEKAQGASSLLWGRTVEPNGGASVPWVRVLVSAGGFQAETASRADGSYFIEAPQAEARVMAQRVGLRTTEFQTNLSSDVRLDIPVHWGDATLQIHVNWSGPSGISAHLTAPCNPGDCGPTPDGFSTGIFRFGALSGIQGLDYARGPLGQARVQPGEWDLVANAGGAAPARTTLDVQPGQYWELEARLSAQRLVTVGGVVRDAATRQPLQDVHVDVRNEPRSESTFLRTDATGRFSVQVPSGIVRIGLQPYANSTRALYGATYYPTYWVGEVTSNRTDLEFGLARTHAWPAGNVTIQGWVVDAATSRGVADARLGLRNEDTYEWGEAQTGPDGSYRFDADQGRYTLAVRGDSMAWTLESLDAPAGTVWQNLTVWNQDCCLHHGWFGRLTEPDYYVPARPGSSPTPSPAAPTQSPNASAQPVYQPVRTFGVKGLEANPAMGSGEAAYQGFAGGLGLYRPAAVPPSLRGAAEGDTGETDTSHPAPGAPPVVAVAGIGVVAALVALGRRRQ